MRVAVGFFGGFERENQRLGERVGVRGFGAGAAAAERAPERKRGRSGAAGWRGFEPRNGAAAADVFELLGGGFAGIGRFLFDEFDFPSTESAGLPSLRAW